MCPVPIQPRHGTCVQQAAICMDSDYQIVLKAWFLLHYTVEEKDLSYDGSSIPKVCWWNLCPCCILMLALWSPLGRPKVTLWSPTGCPEVILWSTQGHIMVTPRSYLGCVLVIPKSYFGHSKVMWRRRHTTSEWRHWESTGRRHFDVILWRHPDQMATSPWRQGDVALFAGLLAIQHG